MELITELYDRIILHNYITDVYYEIISQNYITKLNYEIILQNNIKTTSAIISQQIHSCRSSRFVHPNPFVATHQSPDRPPNEPKDLPDSPEDSLGCTQATCQATLSCILWKRCIILERGPPQWRRDGGP